MKKILVLALFALLFIVSSHFSFAEEAQFAPDQGVYSGEDPLSAIKIDPGTGNTGVVHGPELPPTQNPNQQPPQPTGQPTEQQPLFKDVPPYSGPPVGGSGSSGAGGSAGGWLSGINIINTQSGLSNATSQQFLKNVLNWGTGVLAVLFMTAMVASGIIMVVSIGNQSAFDTAKKWLTYSIIGLIIALLAFVIINTIGGWLGVKS